MPNEKAPGGWHHRGPEPRKQEPMGQAYHTPEVAIHPSTAAGLRERVRDHLAALQESFLPAFVIGDLVWVLDRKNVRTYRAGSDVVVHRTTHLNWLPRLQGSLKDGVLEASCNLMAAQVFADLVRGRVTGTNPGGLYTIERRPDPTMQFPDL